MDFQTCDIVSAPYPPPPWVLRGEGYQTPRLIDVRRARPLVSPQLDIVTVWPGKTIGGLYLASYGPDSSLEYHELIAFTALARWRTSLGFWVSHIYVDSERSMRGGREIWGLPKHLAAFRWRRDRIEVSQDGAILCSLEPRSGKSVGRHRMRFPAFGLRDGDLTRFYGGIDARIKLAPASHWSIPADSPLAALGLSGGPTLHYAGLEMVAEPPEFLRA